MTALRRLEAVTNELPDVADEYVYMLWNLMMPDIVKIGRTHLSPEVRAEQLSRPSGVPYPFEVVCHIRVADARRVERAMHARLAAARVYAGREFFRVESKGFLVGLFLHHPRSIAFTDCQVSAFLEPGNEADVFNAWAAQVEDGVGA